jgi:hypothetical protein
MWQGQRCKAPGYEHWKDWLDMKCPGLGREYRLPNNKPAGHKRTESKRCSVYFPIPDESSCEPGEDKKATWPKEALPMRQRVYKTQHCGHRQHTEHGHRNG